MDAVEGFLRARAPGVWGANVRRLGPPALITCLVVVALILAIQLLRADASVLATPQIPLLVLAGLWIAFELVTLHLQFGREVDDADEVVLTEIPLALALMFATPADLLVVGVGVPIVMELFRRRKGAIKQVFNGASRAVEVALAVTVYRALGPSEPFSFQGWVEISAAVAASGGVSALAVSSVISLAVGRAPGRDFLIHVATAIPVSLVGAALAFVAGLALQTGSTAVAPLVVCTVALLALFWSSSVLTQRRMDLASLHDLGERFASMPDVESTVGTALHASAEMLLAPQARIYLDTPGGASDVLQIQRTSEGALLRTQVDRGSVPLARGLEPGRRSVVVSAPVRPGHDMVISVARQGGASRAFRRVDVRILEMIARHTAAELQKTQLIERLGHDALHDPLTDLANRRLLLELLDHRLKESAAIVLVSLGVHDVQAVNGALGYDRGDELIIQVGRRLQDAIGPDGVVARVGGSDFAVVLPPTGAGQSDNEVVADLLRTLSRPILLTDVEVLARVSAGLAVANDASRCTGADLLRRSDIAMRCARDTGRPLKRYDPRLDAGTAERIRLAAELQAAIPRGELVLYGQPQVALEDDRVIGVEALVRWNHPRLGLLSPNAFVPLAEQAGLDRAMTAWVLNAALKALAGWQATGLQISVSVNVPPSALADHHMRDLTDELLTLRGVSGEHLVLEITEGGLLTNTAAASRVLEDLSSLGVKVSIDDFGTGFSSLSRLRRLPVDEIKVDRRFVATMLKDDDDAAIVRSVVDLARTLGLSCVAEGVEDPAIYAALQQLGCDGAQGYLIATPMPLDQIHRWIGQNSAPWSRAHREDP